jgi:hypothetical protein
MRMKTRNGELFYNCRSLTLPAAHLESLANLTSIACYIPIVLRFLYLIYDDCGVIVNLCRAGGAEVLAPHLPSDHAMSVYYNRTDISNACDTVVVL